MKPSIVSLLFGIASAYRVVWNVPTGNCYGHLPTGSLQRYGISANPNNAWMGDVITLMYNTGVWPYVLKNGTWLNGGVPQNSNITLHLATLKEQLQNDVGDPSYGGLIVLDFEAWRPLWGENYDSLNVYQKASIQLVQREQPSWNSSQVLTEAEAQFDAGARTFFEYSLYLVTGMYPNAKAGYYGFPRCDGPAWVPANESCSWSGQHLTDDKLSWLWEASTALFPRIYLDGDNHTSNYGEIVGLTNEAIRVATKAGEENRRKNANGGKKPLVYPYGLHRYGGGPPTGRHLYDSTDMLMTMRDPSLSGADGVVIWGSSSNVNSSNCEELASYLTTTLGPQANETVVAAAACSKSQCSGHGNCRAYPPPLPPNAGGGTDLEGHQRVGVAEQVVDDANASCVCHMGWSGPRCSEPARPLK